jgi:hypothetical protein
VRNCEWARHNVKEVARNEKHDLHLPFQVNSAAAEIWHWFFRAGCDLAVGTWQWLTLCLVYRLGFCRKGRAFIFRTGWPSTSFSSRSILFNLSHLFVVANSLATSTTNQKARIYRLANAMGNCWLHVHVHVARRGKTGSCCLFFVSRRRHLTNPIKKLSGVPQSIHSLYARVSESSLRYLFSVRKNCHKCIGCNKIARKISFASLSRPIVLMHSRTGEHSLKCSRQCSLS